MEDKNKILSQEEEEKVSGGDFDIYNPDPILKVFCHKCGSDNLTKGMNLIPMAEKYSFITAMTAAINGRAFPCR